MLVAGSWQLGAGLWFLAPGSWFRVTGYSALGTLIFDNGQDPD